MGACLGKDAAGEEFGYLGPNPRAQCPEDLAEWKRALKTGVGAAATTATTATTTTTTTTTTATTTTTEAGAPADEGAAALVATVVARPGADAGVMDRPAAAGARGSAPEQQQQRAGAEADEAEAERRAKAARPASPGRAGVDVTVEKDSSSRRSDALAVV